MEHAVEPYRMMLLDGKEHDFFLSGGAMKRALRLVGARSEQDVTAFGVDFLFAIFYASCVDIDRNEVSLDDFTEQITGDFEALTEAFAEMKALHGVKRPTVAVAGSPPETSN